MQIGAPTASVESANPTGWSDKRLFFAYVKHFISCERPCMEGPALLILDNHE
jgi:hypothetical protein